jgi:hypothetical protein
MPRRNIMTAAVAAVGGGVIGSLFSHGFAEQPLLPGPGQARGFPGFVWAVGDGIDPTGHHDSTPALQRLLDAAQATGGVLLLPAGTYKTSGLVTAESFIQPSIVGAGTRATVLVGSGAAPVITLTGGSGELCGARIGDLTVTGSRAVGIQLLGVGGVTVERVRFDSLATGLLFHNESRGSFTEFDVAASCIFENSVALPVEYRRGAGDESFHGAGFRDSVFVQGESARGPLVKIGQGCLLYNAPWDATLFANAAAPLTRNDSSRHASTSGVIRIESSETADGCVIVDPASPAAVYHAGELLYHGNQVTAGDRFRPVYVTQFNSDGSLSAFRRPYTAEVSLSTGTTSVLAVDSNAATTVSVTVVGPQYTHNDLLYVFRDPFGDAGTVTTVAVGYSFDDAGHGPPEYGIEGGHLTITNQQYPSAGTTAWLGVSQLSSRTPFPLL